MSGSTMPSGLAEAIDLEQYPIGDLTSAEAQAVVARCRGMLARDGACDLEGFLRPEAVAAIVAEIAELAPGAFHKDTTHNVYFAPDDPALPVDDPRRRRVRTAKGGLAYDEIPQSSLLRVAYESDELTAFVAAAVGLDVLYRHADPLGALNVMLYEEGDELGWHFDGSDFVVTLLLQAPESGGVFEYAPMLRGPDDENIDGVGRLLDGDRSGVREMSQSPGTLALFRGRYSPHHVTSVEGATPRINAVLSYAPVPDAMLTDYGKQIFYGRVR